MIVISCFSEDRSKPFSLRLWHRQTGVTPHGQGNQTLFGSESGRHAAPGAAAALQARYHMS
jgi:hypothetical protein